MQSSNNRGDSVGMCARVEMEMVEMVLRGAGESEMRGGNASAKRFDSWFESTRGNGGRKRIPKNGNRR